MSQTLSISSIQKLDFPNFDIGNKIGFTNYIDFIQPNELVDGINIMKGRDIYSRFFLIFKAIFEFEDGTTFPTFSTFFQRYTQDESLYHCCGHHGIYIMNTEGGTNLNQFQFIEELVTNGVVNLDKLKCIDLRLNFCKRKPFEEIKQYPIRVRIG